jgi:pyruvate dehydrogenase E1 component alpha subunit
MEILEKMLLARAFEDQLRQLAAERGRVPGMQILCIGQEAAVSAVLALEPEDVMVTNHRSHAHLLARGADPNALLAEIMGKATGVNHGRSGTLHLVVPEVNARMTSTVVGAGPLLAVGAAFAQQYTGGKGITAVFFGDGAAAEGSVHEAMNLAGVWKLPLLFVCENNCWAGAQAFKAHCSAANVAQRAASYGMPGERVDGNDPDAVLRVTIRLANHCRRGDGPALMELATYRMRGHGEHDPQHYVDPAELEQWSARDPIRLFGKRLADEGLVRQEQFRAMEEQARRIVTEALAFADTSPYPDPDVVLAHVWADGPAHAPEVV